MGFNFVNYTLGSEKHFPSSIAMCVLPQVISSNNDTITHLKLTYRAIFSLDFLQATETKMSHPTSIEIFPRHTFSREILLPYGRQIIHMEVEKYLQPHLKINRSLQSRKNQTKY